MAALTSRLRDPKRSCRAVAADLEKGMSAEGRIFVNADQPVGAQLRYPGRVLLCGSIREAVSAWRKLPEDVRLGATIRGEDGATYGASDIPKLFNK